MDCVFCKIVNKEVEGKIVYEDNNFLSFKDVNPKAPLHVLIIPKRHTLTISYLDDKNKELIGDLFLTAKKIAVEQGVSDTGYRLIINIGQDAGQTVPHLHLHLLGGEKLL